MRIFGIDPGSERTGYGCIDAEAGRCRLVTAGAILLPRRLSFPEKLQTIHRALRTMMVELRPEAAAVESVFYAANVRSALMLGHARGAALLAAADAGVPIAEYAPAEVKRAVVGYGRAEKRQVQRMVALLLGLDRAPDPYDAADALAAAICHLHLARAIAIAEAHAGLKSGAASQRAGVRSSPLTSWRQYRPPDSAGASGSNVTCAFRRKSDVTSASNAASASNVASAFRRKIPPRAPRRA